MSETSPAPRKRRGRVALILLGLILAVLIGLGTTTQWARAVYEAPGPLAAERALVIPRGGTEAIAGALKEAGIIADARHFLIASQVTKGAGPLRAAEFAFPAGASLKQVLEILREARPVQRRVTIPEGLSALQIQALLDKTEGLMG
ncbi:MAG: endolytic transglycosylase MltG, partial [Alphaproteobacteria bacterium]